MNPNNFQTINTTAPQLAVSPWTVQPTTMEQPQQSVAMEQPQQLTETNAVEASAAEKTDLQTIIKNNEAAAQNLIQELELERSADVMAQVRNCVKVQRYIALHNEYDESVISPNQGESRSEASARDLHNALVRKRGVSTSNSLEMRDLLNSVGVNAECVALASTENSAHHMSVIAEHNGQWYYYDPTLEGFIYRNEINNGEQATMCAAGLGSQEYNRFYKPLGVISRNADSGVEPMPTNIAAVRIPAATINAI